MSRRLRTFRLDYRFQKQCGFSSLALTNGSRLQRNGQVISKMNMLQPDALGVLVILG